MKHTNRPIAGNTNTGLLKWLALIFMFLDHAGKMCFPNVPEMRILGRIAFPLYCWCMVVGAQYTRSFPKYLLRIAVIGLISQPLYMVALHHPWKQVNIFLTLFVALLGLWGLREKKLLSHIWAPVLALILAQVLHVDYGWKGVLLVFLLWGARSSKSAIAAVMIAFCLFWGSSSSVVSRAFGVTLTGLNRGAFGAMFSALLRLQAMAILALPLMLWKLPGRIPLPKWTGYAIYPGHLVALIALEYAIGKAVHWENLVNAWQQFIALF